jgi:hypothetical protein
MPNHFIYDRSADCRRAASVIFFAPFFILHFICDIPLNRQQNSSDVFIDSTTLPLHIFCQVHFPSVSNFDSNPAVSVRFIDSTTLPLHGDPIHNVCDVPLAPWKLADWGIISTITYRKIES